MGHSWRNSAFDRVATLDDTLGREWNTIPPLIVAGAQEEAILGSRKFWNYDVLQDSPAVESGRA
jgi:hypothetical protein